MPFSAQVLARQEYLVVPEQSLQEDVDTWSELQEGTPLHDSLPPATQVFISVHPDLGLPS